jgi:hypothetical protein
VIDEHRIDSQGGWKEGESECPTCCRVFGGVKGADWGSGTYRTSVSELREADRRMGQYAAGRREHGVSWDLADPEPDAKRDLTKSLLRKLRTPNAL